MKCLEMLVKRNIDLYLKNKQSVFFSFLSMLIILALNTVFLGEVNIDYIKKFAPISRGEALYLTNCWLMAGIIVVNVVMVAINMLSYMIQDEEKHKLQAFLVAPISRNTIVLGYIIAASIVSFAFGLITLGLSQVYMIISGGTLLNFIGVLKLIGFMVINVISIVPALFCIAALVYSSSSYGAITTTIGTLIGFIAGIYLPIGSLPELVQKILKCFPILYAAAGMREIYTQQAIDKVFANAPIDAVHYYKEFMGITISWNSHTASLSVCLLILCISAIIFTILSGVLIKTRKTADR